MFCQKCNIQNPELAKFCKNCGAELLRANNQSSQYESHVAVSRSESSDHSTRIKTGIEVSTSFFPLAFFLFFCTPIIEINGQKNRRSWGTYFFELKPGEYDIEIYFHYLFMPKCGANRIMLSIMDGQTRRIRFDMPMLMFEAGTIMEY